MSRRFARSGKLEATTDMSRLGECDVISVCVPTPLGKTKDPDMSYIVAATEAIVERLRPGPVVVLESTTYPGTTRELMLPRFESSGLQVGKDFFLCFSPERVDPGQSHVAHEATPRRCWAASPRSAPSSAGAIYQLFIDDVVEVTSPEACGAREAAREHLPHDQHRSGQRDGDDLRPARRRRVGSDRGRRDEAVRLHEVHAGPGLGGHCIPLDPHYLAWKMRTLHYKTRMIELAGEINTEMPAFWVGKLQDALNDVGKPLKGSKVLVLGVAYKKDIDDLRESPALEILDLLTNKGVVVSYHDPYVPEIVADGHTPAGAVGRVRAVHGRGAARGRCRNGRDRSLVHRLRSRLPARAAVIDTRNACARHEAAHPERAVVAHA